MTTYRSDIEVSFSQRIREVEDRFAGDQDSVARRFQADVLKLEQHYQSELKALSESHAEQKLRWEAQLQEALENAEGQRRRMEESVEQERERLDQQWKTEQRELGRLHKEEAEELARKNRQLQNELEEFISRAQTKEIELSRQLNDLHSRLQESLETKDELLAQSEKKALELELLLNQTVEDFKQEREELLSSQSELEAKNGELLSISERQISERIELLTERDDLRMKIEELEALLKQAAVDFELERKELQEHVTVLEEKLKDNPENERDVLKIRIKELEMELSRVSSPAVKSRQESCFVPPEICLNDAAILGQDVDVEIITEEVKMDPTESDGHDAQKCVSESDEAWPESAQEAGGEPHAGCCSADIRRGDPDEKNSNAVSEIQTVSPEMPCDAAPSLEALEGEDAVEVGEKTAALGSCEEGNKPQDAPAADNERSYRDDVPCHGTVVDPSVLEEMGDPGEPSPVGAEVTCSAENSHGREQEDELVSDSDCERLTAEIKDDYLESPEDEEADWEEREYSLLKLQALYSTATEENVLLHEKISLLQQKTEILENLLAHNSEKLKTGHQILEENYSLKVNMLLLMEHVKELQVKALKTTELQIRYEDCVCENAKLKDQNGELEKRVWSLEGKMNFFLDFQDHSKISLADDISRMRGENSRLSVLFSELERQQSPAGEALLDLTGPLEVKDQAATDLEERCEEFEKGNTSLRRAITELQDKSQTLNEATQAHR